MKTRAVKKGDKYVINGSKCFITNGTYADYFTVYAKTDPEAGHRGISAFVVDADLPGVSVDKKEDKMGQRPPTPRPSPSTRSRSRPRTCSARRTRASSWR